MFFAGESDLQVSPGIWVCSMGHLTGLFDRDFLDIPATGRLTWLRYAEFHKVEGDVITESATFIDILSLMHQAGVYPLPPSTGAMAIYPGPRTHDGLVTHAPDPAETRATYDLSTAMLTDLAQSYTSPADHLARWWHPDMNWFGPTGIGTSLGFPGYRRGHTGPFETLLDTVEIHDWELAVAAGNFSAVMWWPCLTMRNTGGYMGVPANDALAHMRVVDLYRRDGDKLAENWIFIDLLHFLNMQGVDLLTDNGGPDVQT